MTTSKKKGITYVYYGFESASDLERDMAELFMYDSDFADLDPEWQGTLTVTVEYTPSEDEDE